MAILASAKLFSVLVEGSANTNVIMASLTAVLFSRVSALAAIIAVYAATSDFYVSFVAAPAYLTISLASVIASIKALLYVTGVSQPLENITLPVSQVHRLAAVIAPNLHAEHSVLLTHNLQLDGHVVHLVPSAKVFPVHVAVSPPVTGFAAHNPEGFTSSFKLQVPHKAPLNSSPLLAQVLHVPAIVPVLHGLWHTPPLNVGSSPSFAHNKQSLLLQLLHLPGVPIVPTEHGK